MDIRGRIARCGNFRLVRRDDLALPELLPVHLPEPRVCEDVAGAVLQIAVALRRVVLEELENQICRVLVERRPADRRRALADLLVQHDVARVWLVERRQAREHLEYEHTEGIPIHGFVVPLIADDL